MERRVAAGVSPMISNGYDLQTMTIWILNL